MGKFEIKSSKGQFSWVLKADNNEVILTSETYTSKESAEKGILSVKKNAILDANFERLLSKSKEPYFTLRAENHEVIGTSEMYLSTEARDKGIAAVMKDAPRATVH